MSAVTVLAAGVKADSGVGAAVDVTGCAVLKLSAIMKANFGALPQLTLALDIGPTVTGPWTEVFSQSFRSGAGGSNTWPQNLTQRIVCQPDNFVRARWDGHATNAPANGAAFDIAITGVGSPDA